MDAEVTSVTVLDRHSGTTGRAHLALTGDPSLPATLFAKLAPFDAEQRAFVNVQGMGVAEARLYRDLAPELPVRVPGVWFADFEGDGRGADDRYVMLLEDLVASGCRFPSRDDADIEARIFDIVEQLARLHAQYWESPRFADDGDLAWIAPRSTSAGDGGASDGAHGDRQPHADRLPAGFLELAELYEARSRDVMRLYREGERTLVHGDPHLGNLFVDTVNGDRTGFLDWAVIAHAPGMRDVAYVLSASTPTEVRRAHEDALLFRYREILAAARHHARRRDRVGAVPPLHDLRLGRGHLHGRDGIEVAARAHRSRRHRTGDDRRRRPRLRRPPGGEARLNRGLGPSYAA